MSQKTLRSNTSQQSHRLVILGASGTACDVLEIISAMNMAGGNYSCIEILDDNQSLWGCDFHGVKITGPISLASSMDNVSFINTLGSPKNFGIRKVITDKLQLPKERYATILHPSAVISKSSTLEYGVILYPNVVVMANACLGDQVIVLANSVINHDVRIESYTTIASGVNLSGRVCVGPKSYIGSGSSIKEDVQVGKGALVGIGSVVTQDVDDNSVVVGNPAKKISFIK